MTQTLAEAIQQRTLVRAAPEAVYDALSTGPGLDAWFTRGSRVERRPGGEIVFNWVDWGPDRYTCQSKGPVLEAEPGRRFAFRWRPDPECDEPTTVEIDLEPHPEGTLVRLREGGYRDTPSGRRAMLECAAGWGEALTLMKFHLEHGLRY